MVISVGSEAEWSAFCSAIGRPEWRDDERFVDLRTLMRNRAELTALLREAIGSLTFTEVCERLDAHDDVLSAEVAGPGFLNLRLETSVWHRLLRRILQAGE